jgi:hypothetical protein
MPYMGNQPATSFSSVSYQDLTGSNGTSFTLDYPVGNAQEIEVFVNNVRQEPGVAYTANGTELITTGTISISDDFYVVFQGKAQQSATHPANQDLNANNGIFTGTVTANSFIGIPNPSLIINGACSIAQRGTSGTGGDYQSVDRFGVTFGTVAITQSQDTDVPSNQGFSNSFKIECTTASSSTAAYVALYQKIEAQDVRNSGWDYTSSSSYLSISFWAKASVAGTYLWSVRTNDGTAYNYADSYTLAANTWTKITGTIPGNSNISFDNDNGEGLAVYPMLELGSDYTSGSSFKTWTAHTGTTQSPDVTVNFFDTLNATFKITGLKVEVGETATDFIHEDIGTTLIKCQRYCRVYYGDNNYSQMGGTGFAANGTTVNIPVLLNPQMRATPSLSASGNSQLSDGAAGTIISGISVITQQSSRDVLSVAPTATGLTQHRPYRLESANNTTARITISAEL